ncbi:MAG: LolA family protein [bacterium]
MRPYRVSAGRVVQVYAAIILMGAFLAGFHPVGIAAEIIPGVLEGFTGWYATVRSLRADFRQTTFNPLWGEKQEAQGEFWFKKPGLMRWQYTMPQKDVITISEEGLCWYIPEDEQVIRKSKEDAFTTVSPMSLLGENMELEKDFEITGMEEIREEGEDEKGKARRVVGYVIHMKPRNEQMPVTRVDIEVRAEKFSLAAISVEEPSGNTNRIAFEALAKNPEVPADLFRFVPPPGTKVITPKDFPAL